MRGKAGRFSRLVPISPTDLSGLTGWWDASDSATMFDATTGGSAVAADGGVARFEDKSGNGRHWTQGTGASQPVRKTAIQNGRDVLRFDGTNDNMGQSTTYGTLQSSSQSSVFVVANADTVSTDSTLPYQNQVVFAEEAAGHGAFMLRTGTVSAFGYDTFWRVASVSYSPPSWLVLSSWHNGSSLFVQANEGASSSVALNTRTFTNFDLLLGANDGLSNFFDGDLAELITYDVALSDADRNAVISYLMTKWGI